MQRKLEALSDKHFDLVIVGGGIFGICAAWDATLRGLSVGLVEKGDFAGKASAHNFKVVHGGIRYLQHLDVRRLRNSSRERNRFLRTAPHLVRPLPILVPTYGSGRSGKSALAAGAAMYDLLTIDRNRGIADPERRLTSSKMITRREVLDRFPGLPSENLSGGVIFEDGQMFSPARLALSYLKGACERGVVAANYAEVIQMLSRGGRVVGVKVRDRRTGQDFEVHGDVILNAAGAWSEPLLQNSLGISLPQQVFFSRDTYLAINRQLLGDRCGIALRAMSTDPDAIFSRGHRHLFVLPAWSWSKLSLVGVWHRVLKGLPEQISVSEREMQKYVDEINQAYPALELTLDDISSWHAGFVPVDDDRPGEVEVRYGKRSLLIDHEQADGTKGLLTVIGVRYTMARQVGQKVIDTVVGKLGKGPIPSRADDVPVYGGDIDDISDLRQDILKQYGPVLGEESSLSILHQYGSAHAGIARLIKERPELAQSIGQPPVTKAQIIHAVREEMAQTLADVVFRRTELASGGHPGSGVLDVCEDLVATELEWTEAQIQNERDAVDGIFARVRPQEASEPAVD